RTFLSVSLVIGRLDPFQRVNDRLERATEVRLAVSVIPAPEQPLLLLDLIASCPSTPSASSKVPKGVGQDALAPRERVARYELMFVLPTMTRGNRGPFISQVFRGLLPARGVFRVVAAHDPSRPVS